MQASNVTRGSGLLETFLAKKRANMADKLIPSAYRTGRILDIGCGTYPLFLLNTKFKEKHAVEKNIILERQSLLDHGINAVNCDIELNKELPFESEYFDVVSMLAVFEHIDQCNLPGILKEIHRTLRKGGIFILTTPAGWTHNLLELMSKLNLVSCDEIDEHKAASSPRIISSFLQRAAFSSDNLRYGYFEMFMNIWLVAEK